MIVLLIQALSIFCFSWYFYQVIYSLYFGPLRDVPSPLIFQLIPFYFDLTQGFGNSHTIVHNYHLKYGKIFRIGWRRLAIIDPEATASIYGSYRFEKASTYEGLSYFGENLASTRSREKHIKKRKIISPAFTRAKLLEMEPTIIKSGLIPLIENMEKAARNDSIVNLYGQFHYMSWDIIGELVFGESFHMLKDGVHPIIEWVENILIFIMICFGFPFMRGYKISSGEKLRKFSYDCMDKYFKRHAEEKLEAEKNGSNYIINNLLGHFVEAVDKDTGEKLSKEDIFADAQILLLSGTDTTSSNLSLLFYLLMKNEINYNQVKEEIKKAVSDNPKKIIDYKTCSELTYLKAVVNETLRMYPPFSGCPIRLVPKGGYNVLGHHLHESTEVCVPIYSAQRSPWFWDQPDSFLPERWLETDAKSNDPPLLSINNFVVFSSGPRGCIGKELAYMEILLMAANLLARFDFNLDASDFDIKLIAQPIIRPTHSRINTHVKFSA